ncbi:hypothetical protein FOIG_16786 [Fusarium odoratissimum NRRL 54006]|uniref:Uncharacterized protein n=2 Tax=Fusarium oxysporum species complex TaxID=171631 RepID=X0IM20_FUSO5|nr:uncharacterized protein FOIG_16786 [Fusarium odoratissimum NRRL 54006]EXL89933.1 hypothetical protein FOIG_16786 [Fusarium odoratissimum NRRL 54006]TXB97830.1 hypothetical protein FocTR4_00017118 [Fusarium oxysporum f. sp. cubense]
METYSLKDCFLRVGFYKVTQKLVGQVSEWKSDITQFICDALEKHAGTSKNKDSANDDHPTSKRSRSEGAIDGTASPLQKRAKTVADSHTEVPTAANTGRCLQEHQTPNIGPLTSSPSVTQDRVLRTPFSGTFVRFIDAQAGLNILRAEPDLCDQRTILTLAENYSCLTLHPAPGSNRNIFQDRIAELAKDVSQDWPLGVPRDTDVYRVKRDEGLHHVGTEWCKIKDRARLLVYKNGSTFLTFFLNDEKGGGLRELKGSYQVQPK